MPIMASAIPPILVLIFDIFAFILVVVAEQKRNTPKTVADYERNYTFCVYGSDIATILGVGSFVFLMASQVVLMATTRVFSFGKDTSTGNSKAKMVVLLITCWVTLIVAEVFLLVGSVKNAQQTKYRSIFSSVPPSCQTLRRGIFGTGAAFIVLNCIASELYYICYNNFKNSFCADGLTKPLLDDENLKFKFKQLGSDS